MQIEIWTDGSCQPNPGPGGWAVVMMSGAYRKELHGGLPQTTNIRAELTAAIEALKSLRDGPHEVIFHTDSEYVRGAVEGMKKPKANMDLLKEFSALVARHSCSVKWVRGHTGDRNNERCDYLAKLAAAGVK